MMGPNARRAVLIEAIRAQGGEWMAGRTHLFYRSTGDGPNWAIARDDFKALAHRGLLDRHDAGARRFFTLPGGAV
ncbi:hypothetical protein [Streptomyces boncukensis]|uniref:Uncharacterized protein n=1 Tax=Streptomyces boncukensis TaxID=2711219 RepID=A0A6G4WRV6_9ACTN|nr:hypothetical protein [Streptomyces boncukensis]NGO68009.1 hypothetical protein [Streptomyces boncukensis]